jgi:hypothetical protein
LNNDADARGDVLCQSNENLDSADNGAANPAPLPLPLPVGDFWLDELKSMRDLTGGPMTLLNVLVVGDSTVRDDDEAAPLEVDR